jgi:hypothetical protein
MNSTNTMVARMAAILPSPTAGRDGSDRRLDSWKEIAAYLGRSARCAQRWEQHLGLPVHRIRHAEGYTVYAYVAELEAWRQSRDPIAAPVHSVEVPNDASEKPADPPHALGSRWSESVFNLCRLFLRVVPVRIARS